MSIWIIKVDDEYYINDYKYMWRKELSLTCVKLHARRFKTRLEAEHRVKILKKKFLGARKLTVLEVASHVC